MRKLALAAVASLAFASVARAEIIIDSFVEPDNGVQNGITVTGTGNANAANAEFPGIAPGFSQVIGGFRQLDMIMLTQNSGGSTSEFQFTPIFNYSNQAGSSSVGVLTYDGMGGDIAFNADGTIGAGTTAGAGLGGIDLTEGGNADGTGGANTHFIIDLISIDLTVSTFVEIIDTDGDVSLTDKGTLLPGLNAKLLSAFDNVGAGAGQVDLTSVASIRVILSGPQDTDAVIRLIKVGVVPEPASIALIGLGGLLAGFGVRRRNRQKAELSV